MLWPKSAIAIRRSGHVSASFSKAAAIGPAARKRTAATSAESGSFSRRAEATTLAIALRSPRCSATNRAAAGEIPSSASSAHMIPIATASAKTPYPAGPSVRTRNRVSAALKAATVIWTAKAKLVLRTIPSPGRPSPTGSGSRTTVRPP